LSSFIDNSNYYNQCLQVMSMLLLTGNFLDLSTASPKTAFKITTSVSPASAGSVTVSPVKATYAKGDPVTVTAVPSGANKFVKWGGDLNSAVSPATFTISYDMNITGYFNAGAGDLIDDCEDGNGVTNLGGKWFTYTDSTDKGLSTVTPKTTPTLLFTMTDGGANSSLKAAKISYTLNKGSNPYNPYAGFGFWLKKQSTTDTVLDISAASGLTFYFKGDSCDVRVETTNITDFAYFKVRLPKAADWTLVTLQWSSFKQASWTTAPKTFDRTKATKIAWQSPDNFVTGQSGVIWVDDIHLPGFVVPTETKQTARASILKQGISIASDNAKSMTIRYSLASAGPVEITLFDLSGKIAHRLFSGERQSGFNTQNVGLPGAMPRGTYLVQVKSGSNVYSDKISFVK
ncbi:MAG TPA: T9SS type A sorting domain-containing protein, partial [Chitinivibrionales bacterium]